MVEKKKFWLNGKLLQEDAYFIEFKKNLAKQSEEVSPSRYGAISNSAPEFKISHRQAWRGIGLREKGLPISLKSFTLLDELSLEGSLRKSVQGECCAASLLAGITEPQPRTQRVNSEAPLSLPPAAQASTSQSARRNFPCEKEISVLKKKEFHFAKKMFTL